MWNSTLRASDADDELQRALQEALNRRC